ncbi:MAG: dehydrogenase [Flavobacteriales bacterium]|nr:dehydrogenase [Flavobacteriales bacterium]
MTQAQAESLYSSLSLPRAIEDRMLISLRQGRISKWFSSYGQEAVSVGLAQAMEPDEWICTMHRNLGVFTTRGVDLVQLFSQFQGSVDGFTKGRDRSFHFGSRAHKIFGMISHLGAQLGVADGLALAQKLRNDKRCTLVFTGDGGASEGDFHESLNVAAVWQLPVLIVVENNQWGLSTPSSEQFVHGSFVNKGPAYGMEAHSVDGNDLMAVQDIAKQLTASIRENPRPILLECMTYRVRGHEEASGTKYYPEGMIDAWSEKDPLLRLRQSLNEAKLLTHNAMDAIDQSHSVQVLADLEQALTSKRPVYQVEEELRDLFAEEEPLDLRSPLEGEDRPLRMIDAIHEALGQGMDRHDNLVLMGQDIADYGGVFKATDGFSATYGKGRVRNTPICESAIVGAAVGLSTAGFKTMVEMQFSDFVTEAMTQICNQAAKLHYRWGQNVDMVIRMPTGASVNAGPFHSQSTEAWFTRVPGLKVVYPSNPYDAKGLLASALESKNPVLFFEHKALYRSKASHVPESTYFLPLDQAKVIQQGDALTVITYGLGVHWMQKHFASHADQGIELIDLIALAPLDFKTCNDSVKKTGKCLVLIEDSVRGSVGRDIAQMLNESCFSFLDSAVKVLGSHATPIPFSAELEEGYLPENKIDEAISSLLSY